MKFFFSIILAFALGALATWSFTEDSDLSPQQQAPLSDGTQNRFDALAFAEKSGMLRVGIDPSYFPYEYIDEAGRLQGFDVDYSQAIGSGLNFRISFKHAPLESSIDRLLRRQLDFVISGLEVTKDREAYLDFIPYVKVPQALITKADSSFDLSNPRGTLGILTASMLREKLEQLRNPEDPSQFIVRAYEKIDILMKALEGGDVDAILVNFTAAKDLPSSLAEHVKVTLQRDYFQQLGIALHPNDRALKDKVMAFVQDFNETPEYKAMVEAWAVQPADMLEN